MRTGIILGLMLIGIAACGDGSTDSPGSVGTPVGNGRVRFSIRKLSDCQSVRNYPYARNLFCPAAFSAAQTIAAQLADSLGAKRPTRRIVYFYQTLADPEAPPDDQAQTTAACTETRPPWRRSRVTGAGTPLCHLVAYVTSVGPVASGGTRTDNPVPDDLHVFPQYFGRLYPADPALFDQYQVGGTFDPVVRSLGAAAIDGFLADYPSFAPDAIYDPARWSRDLQYHGISGGGGSGWGGEVDVEHPDAAPATLLAFGGGGGGGMTSTRGVTGTASRVGGGGGGGTQIADGYRSGGRVYNGLGLGAGVGSDETAVEYSYFDYEGSGRAPRPVHEYSPAVIDDYETQLSSLTDQLRSSRSAGATVVLRGGGGMGGGAEYLMDNGEEFTPHALSTQAGFQFRYEFAEAENDDTALLGAVDAEQADAYAHLGDHYRQANTEAYKACGRDYSNFACICPTAHAIVICLMGRELGDPTKIPSWLQQQHCPNDPSLPNQPVEMLTSYQHLLLDSARALSENDVLPPPTQCNTILRTYFESLNTPE